MKRRSRIAYITLVVAALSFACGKKGSSGLRSGSPNGDEPVNATGAVNKQGLPYAGYNPDEIAKVMREEDLNSKENRAFATQIEDVVVTHPKQLDPSIQNQQQGQNQSRPNTPPTQGAQPVAPSVNTKPVQMSLKWKGIDNPLLFQGTLTLDHDKYRAEMTDVSGQRSDLSMTATCDDIDCRHGKFYVHDPYNRKAVIVVTKDNRVIRYKTPADPISSAPAPEIPADVKQDQKVEVESVQVVPGISKFQIRKIDKDGNPTDVEYKGEMVEPNGECPKVDLSDDSAKTLDSLCLRGYTGEGEFLFKGKLHGKKVPPQQPVPQTPQQQQQQPQTNTPVTPAPVTPPPDDSGPTVYFEIVREPPTKNNAPTVEAPNGNCPGVTRTDNPYLIQIVKDCGHPSVLRSIEKYWGPNGTRNRSMVRFLTLGAQSTGSQPQGDALKFKKMMDILAKSDLPQVMSFLNLEESGFSATAVSTAQALGYWQFVRKTGDPLGLRAVLDSNDRVVSNGTYGDITASTKAFVKHFDVLLDEWQGDVKMAILSYNRGYAGAKGVADKLANRWKNDPSIPDDVKEGYSVEKDFWYIQKYYMTHRSLGINVDYVPDVLGAIMAGTSPSYYNIMGVQGLEMK